MYALLNLIIFKLCDSFSPSFTVMAVAGDLLVAVEGYVPFLKDNSTLMFFCTLGYFACPRTSNVTFQISHQCGSETQDASAFCCRGLATGTAGSHLAISWPLSFQHADVWMWHFTCYTTRGRGSSSITTTSSFMAVPHSSVTHVSILACICD